ncbi:MAG: hypothetical protein WAP35_06460 [Solirubrobacterales bacterium]
MTWVLVAVDDDTLAAVLDDARIRSLDDNSEFLLVTPRSARWGDERDDLDAYLDSLDDRVEALQKEGVAIDHEWIAGDDIEAEIIETGAAHDATGVVIAHHNPSAAIPDPEAFDDRIRQELGVPLDVISLE